MKRFQKLQKKHGVDKLVCLPSSVHEMIILPYEENGDMEVLNNMVAEINQNEVEPEERLTDRAYILTV